MVRRAVLQVVRFAVSPSRNYACLGMLYCMRPYQPEQVIWQLPEEAMSGEVGLFWRMTGCGMVDWRPVWIAAGLKGCVFRGSGGIHRTRC